MHEGRQRDRGHDDAEFHEVLRKAVDSAHQSPEPSRASRSSDRSKSHAATDSDRDTQQHAREAEAGMQDEGTQAQEDREHEEH